MTCETTCRMVFLVTTNNDEKALTSLRKMLATVSAYVAMPGAADVKVFLLFQNATAEALAALDAELPEFVQLKSVDHRVSLSKARNILLTSPDVIDSVGADDIVGYPDDDCWFPEGTLAAMHRAFDEDPELDFWIARYGSDAATPTAELNKAPGLAQVVAKASSNTMYFRGRVFKAIGPFDETLGVGANINGGEDTEYAIRAFYQARKVGLLDQKVIGHRDFDPVLRARYYPGSLVGILRHSKNSPAGLYVAARKLAIGCYFLLGQRLTLGELRKAVTQAFKPGHCSIPTRPA